MERVRLYPSSGQRDALTKMLDVTRQLYNAALEQRIAAYRRCRVSVSAGRALISRRAGRFYALFECEREAWPLPQGGRVVGLDRGVVAVVATSEGELATFPGSVTVRRRAVRAAVGTPSFDKKFGSTNACYPLTEKFADVLEPPMRFSLPFHGDA